MTRILTQSRLLFLTLCPLFFMFVSPAWSGIRDIGNGGYGIIQGQGNIVYLYDFVESGVDANPYLDPNALPDPRNTERLKRALWSGAPVDGVSRKLAEIARQSDLLAKLLLKMIESYNWALVNEDLALTFDGDLSSISVDPKRLVQAAVRNGGSIRIQAGVWRKLPPAHQIGLIFHEAMYSFLDTAYSPEAQHQSNRSLFRPNASSLSFMARTIVGYLFSDRWKSEGRAGLRRSFMMSLDSYYPYLFSLIAGDSIAIRESADGKTISLVPRIGFWQADRGVETGADQLPSDVFFGMEGPSQAKLDQICSSPESSSWVVAYWVRDILLLNENGFGFAPQEMMTLGEYSGGQWIGPKRTSGSSTCREWATRIWNENSGRFEGFHY